MSASATKPVEFDLRRGRVHLRGASERLLLPLDAVRHLCEAAPVAAQREFGRSLGNGIGLSVASRASDDGGPVGGQDSVRAKSADAVLELLGTEIALMGLGDLAFERWGKALVLVLDDCPLRGCDAVIEDLLGAALESATGSEVEVVRLDRPAEGAPASSRWRFAACGEAGATLVRAWLRDGVPWGEAIVRLHAPGASPAGGRGGA